MARNVPWADNAGNRGVVATNSVHLQPYYPVSDLFPEIPENEYTLSGTLVNTIVDTVHSGELKSVRRAFGYADNQFRGKAPFTKPDNPYTPEIDLNGIISILLFNFTPILFPSTILKISFCSLIVHLNWPGE